MGDAVWVVCGAQPYDVFQIELRRRFPDVAILFAMISGNLTGTYLLPADRYGKGLYQEEPSVLAQGCMEILMDAVTSRMEQLLNT